MVPNESQGSHNLWPQAAREVRVVKHSDRTFLQPTPAPLNGSVLAVHVGEENCTDPQHLQRGLKWLVVKFSAHVHPDDLDVAAVDPDEGARRT